MKREIITTADGSVSLRIPEWDETYHSKHGAVQEARHVFLKNGLSLFPNGDLSILEVGFGTGLNAFLTLLQELDSDRKIHYTGLEAFPVTPEEWSQINYPEACNASHRLDLYKQMMNSPWNQWNTITPCFQLRKLQMLFQEFAEQDQYDLIYFDAFGYRVQPELWSESIFAIMQRALKPGGILVTYAARTVIRKNLLSAGLLPETLPGPPGKREMTRARKPM